MKLYFITVNQYKIREATDYLSGSGIELQDFNYSIQEILHIELEIIVKDKVLKAYQRLGLPCVVEHGGLYIDALKGLPGGLSKVVWDTVDDKICNFLQEGESRSATAKSVIGYCDGKKIHIFTGETRGTIADYKRGNYEFQWDPIFIPDGTTQTYAELGFPAKKEFSQAAKAWESLKEFLITLGSS